jgi:hypothetical protein
MGKRTGLPQSRGPVENKSLRVTTTIIMITMKIDYRMTLNLFTFQTTIMKFTSPELNATTINQ